MDIRHLEYFAEVAKQLSFTKAASILHVSQPSISKAIKNLETELGVPLFYRSPKQLELTDAGKAVLTNATKVLEAFHNLTEELSDITALKSGEIRIGIPPIIGAAFFSQLISEFKGIFPSVKIILTEVGTIKIKQGIEDGSLDIGLICNKPTEHHSFDMIELLNDPLMLIVHKEHSLALKDNVYFSDLKEEAFILYRNDFSLHDRIVNECLNHGFSPNVVCESSQRDFMIEMVEAKLGIAFLPSKICKQLKKPSIVSIPLNDSFVSLELGMIWKKDKYLSFAVREFISMAQNQKENG